MTFATGPGETIPWDFVAAVGSEMGRMTREGFVGIWDSYYVAVETGQRFFVNFRIVTGMMTLTASDLLGAPPGR